MRAEAMASPAEAAEAEAEQEEAAPAALPDLDHLSMQDFHDIYEVRCVGPSVSFSVHIQRARCLSFIGYVPASGQRTVSACLKTPQYTNITIRSQPSDDTFLLMDAIAADKAALRALRPRIAVEIGWV